MADCCQQLSSELAQLRAEVAKLRPVDEEAIINKAVERTKAKLLPFIDQALALAKLAYELAKTVEQIAKSAQAIAKAAEAVAKAAKAIADTLKPLLALIPFIPTIIALCAIAGLILGFAARLSNAELRIGVLENGLVAVNSTIGSVINSVMRLQQQLAALQLRPGPKGDKGDRGSDGQPGYTPVKGRDYFDGRDGKPGYTPVKGKDYFDGKDGQSVKGDRGSDGKPGYTPVKGKDYFDGKDGQSIKGDRGSDGKPGYTPVKGKDYFDGQDGKPGYTPVKGRDYFDGKDGQSIKGDRGEPGQSIKGDRGSDGKSIKGDQGIPGQSIKGDRGSMGPPGKSIKGDRGPMGPPGKSIKGDKGDAEMPTDLSPVLNAIANLKNKVDKTNSELSNNKDRLNAIYDAVNIELAGIISSESCLGGIEPFPYSGLGLRGVQGQLNSIANQIAKVHEDVCNVSDGSSGETPEETDLLQRIYAILGGDIFYATDNQAQPRFSTNAEVSVRSYASILFNEDGSQGSPAICNNILDAINISNAVNYYRMGLHEFPASLPESLISKDEGFLGNLIPNENKDIHNLTRFLTWYVERFDEVIGQWEIPIEIKDSDPSTPGGQPVGIKLPNIAEAIAEMFTLIFQTNINSETMLNIAMRNLAETAQDKQQNFISYKLLQSLTDYVGFKQKDINLKMPLLFTLNKTRYDEILKESEIEVGCVEFDDKFGLEADLMRFREGVSILQAVHKRKLDPRGDIKAQILKYLLDTFKGTEKVNGDDEAEFEEFLREVEVGFTNTAGINNATEPYGRPFTQRPRIRDLTNYEPPAQP